MKHHSSRRKQQPGVRTGVRPGSAVFWAATSMVVLLLSATWMWVATTGSTQPEPAVIEPVHNTLSSSVEDTAEPFTATVALTTNRSLSMVSLQSQSYQDDQAAEDEYSRNARHQELQYLQEVMPNSLMIPNEKTELEAERMLGEMELHRDLQQRIDDHSATPEERQQYVDLHKEKLEEELALIQLCQDVSTNSLDSDSTQSALLCTHIAQSAEQRLQVIEETMIELDNLLASDHYE